MPNPFGRPKGSKNKRTKALEDAIKKGGQSPLEFMLQVMRDKKIDWPQRADMAKAAAPYIHPKLASTEITGDPQKPIEHRLKIEFVKAGE